SATAMPSATVLVGLPQERFAHPVGERNGKSPVLEDAVQGTKIADQADAPLASSGALYRQREAAVRAVVEFERYDLVVHDVFVGMKHTSIQPIGGGISRFWRRSLLVKRAVDIGADIALGTLRTESSRCRAR